MEEIHLQVPPPVLQMITAKKGETISRYTNDRHYIPNINVSYAETKMCDVKSDFPCTDLVIVDSIDIVNLV